MGFKKSFILFLVGVFFLSSCTTGGNACFQEAKLIYLVNTGSCEFIIEINNQYFEPSNVKEFSNQVLYLDTQLITIDYEILPDLSPCSGADMIQLYCLAQRQ
ncbi:hypothetical protein N9R81_06305 [Flavobacteriales bacterium]|nr:hypothetical protein [Flavobacteriales bacterium]